MRKKQIWGLLVFILIMYFASGSFLLYKSSRTPQPFLDITVVNDIVKSAEENWDSLRTMEKLPGLKYGLSYTILDTQGKVVVKTAPWLSGDLNQAISHRDTIVDIYRGTHSLGKLILYNNYEEALMQQKKQLFLACLQVLSLCMAFCLAYALHIQKTIFSPFNQLQAFAKNIAAGNLELPLSMDRKNIFGTFTESFDIMREELKAAREAQRKANESKKELVAQLSHDIKTPVASIKAVAELLRAQSSDGRELRYLETIGGKADQINTLITNMFNATLEELHELTVEPAQISSPDIGEIIRSADYFNKIENISICQCLVWADKNRLTQVIDNIISNSYKYANTHIQVNSYYNGQYLVVEFLDFGSGVAEKELPFLFQKFYRAGNAKGKSGAGLGLFISQYFMNQMQGDILCDNAADGFKTVIMLPLV